LPSYVLTQWLFPLSLCEQEGSSLALLALRGVEENGTVPAWTLGTAAGQELRQSWPCVCLQVMCWVVKRWVNREAYAAMQSH